MNRSTLPDGLPYLPGAIPVRQDKYIVLDIPRIADSRRLGPGFGAKRARLG